MTISRFSAILLAIACVGLGALALSLTDQNHELTAQVAQLESALHSKQEPVPPGFGGGDRGGLRQALEATEYANADLRAEIARLKGVPPPTPAGIPAAPQPTLTTPATPRAANAPNPWLEQIRQQDPERYKQIVADREQRRKEAQDWYDDTMNQLQARAQSPVSPDEVTLVNQISDTLSKLSDLRQQMQAARQLPDDQRQAQMAQLIPEMQTASQQLNTLREQDRALQYQQLAKQLGLTGAKAETLVTTIPQILQNTQYTPYRGGSGGGGGFGFGGGQWNAGTPPTAPAR